MKLEFQEIQSKKIVNVHKHIDGPWFWTKYTAHPYIGCRSGCEFCYFRGGAYLGRRDPDNFDTLIQVKTNAVELLRVELGRLPPDLIFAGDWQQPAEDRFHLSRAMLEVLAELRFPLFVVERSPLLLRDLDLLQEINALIWSGVVYSISSVDPALKRAFEPHSPGIKRRQGAHSALADAGISVGVALMPVIPILGDDATHLEDVIVAARDHGAGYVIAGDLTMDGMQAERTLAAAGRVDARVEMRLRQMYNEGAWKAKPPAPAASYPARLGRLVRELCRKHGILDRMPRPISGGPLSWNKRLAEKLLLKTYDLELEGAAPHKIWAYRKAGWTIDELDRNIVGLYAANGEAGLRRLPEISSSMAAQIARWLQAHQITPIQ